MRTIATQIKQTIEAQCPNTFSLYAGYGFKENRPVSFPQGVQVYEKRRTDGRMLKARYRYADGSELEYAYLPARETYRLTAH
jgi:hypothetical protein